MPTLITLSGLAGAGKSSVAQLIKSYLSVIGVTSAVFEFGDFPKQSMANLLNKSVEDLYGTVELKNKNRAHLIHYAQMMKFFCGNDVWAKQLLNKINGLHDLDVIIVPDLRFPEELHVLNGFNGKMYNASIWREEVIPFQHKWLKEGYENNLLTGNQLYQYHNIDKELNPMAWEHSNSFDWTIYNDATRIELHNQIENFINEKLIINGKLIPRVSRTV
jgi:hypothetical protein